MDDKFASHDDEARVGETVYIVGEDIRQFAAISQKVVDNLDAWIGGAPSPTISQSPLVLTLKEKSKSPDDPNGLMALDLQLSLLARKLGLWTVEQCSDGTRNFVDTERMREAFSAHTEADLREAIAELKTDGFIETSEGLGGQFPAYRPNLELYLTFDGIAFGTNTMADIVQVAEAAIAYVEGVDVPELFKKTGWTLRRFNPILDYVASQIPDGRVVRTWGTGFTIVTFFVMEEDKVQLKRFIKRLQG